MGTSVHLFRVYESRRTTHPIFSDVEKFWFTVAATDLPPGISTAANAREPVGLNRRVYRDVRESLEGKTNSVLGTFDLMNKGITILAEDVHLVDKEKNLFEVKVDNEVGGIVDGAHTAKIIWESNDEGTTPPEQHVEVYIRTRLNGGIITDIARGLNTGMQVAPKSIYNIDNVFDWLKGLVAGTSYENAIAWRESDTKEYDVRDLISALELVNVFDFPNDCGKHPIAAYEKWSIPLEKFAADFAEHRTHLRESKYYKLRALLPGVLQLLDHVRRDFRPLHNEAGGKAGRMNIVEEASGRRKHFEFTFSGLAPEKYRLTKGAAYPIVGAFRNYVEIDPETGDVAWAGGLERVLAEWKDVGPLLVRETFNATQDIGHMPDQLGKNRKHWDNLHMKVQLRLLTAQLAEKRTLREPVRKRR